MVRTAIATLAIWIATCVTALAGEHDPKVLRVALLPDENAATVIQDNAPLVAYLQDQLDRDIDLIVTTDYSSMIEAMRFGRIDIAYFGPASYTIAKDRMADRELDIEPFAARVKDGSTTYQSVLITRIDSGITSISDLNGADVDIAFGDPASTSSHFAPKYMLLSEGIEVGVDYSEHFTGGHDAVAVNVQAGNAQVGGLSRPIFEKLSERGSIDASQLRVISYSNPIPQYPWVLRTDMDPELQDAIRDAFWSLTPDSDAGPTVLGPFKAEGFAPIDDASYDVIRNIRALVQEGS